MEQMNIFTSSFRLKQTMKPTSRHYLMKLFCLFFFIWISKPYVDVVQCVKNGILSPLTTFFGGTSAKKIGGRFLIFFIHFCLLSLIDDFIIFFLVFELQIQT